MSKPKGLKKGNHKQYPVNCAFCKKEFFVSKYRIERPIVHGLCCSYSCAANNRKSEMGTHNKIPPHKIEQIKDLVLNTNKPLTKISEEIGISRDTIIRYKQNFKWKRAKRPSTLRENYRKAASKKLGRPLIKYEQVHHIDLDTHNNDLSNLFVYKDARDHTIAHKSLESCAVFFLKRGLVKFNETTGLYEPNKINSYDKEKQPHRF